MSGRSVLSMWIILHLRPAFHFGSWFNGGRHSRWGLVARTRLDLSPRLSLDLMPGLVIGDSPYPGGFSGYTAGASLMPDNWIGFSAAIDVTKTGFNGDHDAVLRTGVDLGSMPGLCVTAAAATAGTAAYLISRTN